MILNPWKRIAHLEATLATVEQHLEYERENTQRHISDAIYHGIEREVQRRKYLEMQNVHLMEQMTDLQSLSFPKSIIATMNGDDIG